MSEISDRFFKYTMPVGDCLIWTGGKTSGGYGNFKNGRKQVRAHRYSFEFFKGKIPDKMIVCHRCDTPLCVNPSHLFLGTMRENTNDSITKGRFVGNRKMTPEKIKNLIKHFRNGKTRKQLSYMYRIHYRTVAGLIRDHKNT